MSKLISQGKDEQSQNQEPWESFPGTLSLCPNIGQPLSTELKFRCSMAWLLLLSLPFLFNGNGYSYYPHVYPKCTGCIWNIQWNFKLKNYCSKKHSTVNPPQAPSPRFKTTYLTVAATLEWLWSPLSGGSLQGVVKNTRKCCCRCQRQAHKNMMLGLRLAYSPDLVLCGFWLSPKVKMTMNSKCFELIQDIEAATTRQGETLRKETSRSVSESGK